MTRSRPSPYSPQNSVLRLHSAAYEGPEKFFGDVGAVYCAFDGIAVLLAMVDTTRGERIWVIPLLVITGVMLLAEGWAWEPRKTLVAGRPCRDSTDVVRGGPGLAGAAFSGPPVVLISAASAQRASWIAAAPTAPAPPHQHGVAVRCQ